MITRHQSPPGARLRDIVRHLTVGALLSLLVSGAACWDHCNHPDRATYSCQPLPAGSADPGCPGIRGDDADRLYPVGCQVVKPECLAAFPDSAASCTCQSHGQADGGAGADWWCPI